MALLKSYFSNPVRNQSQKIILSIVVLLFLVSHISYTQLNNYHQYDFYDNKNGMSQGTVNSIVQDKYGYMWFGTQDGLNKFDGVNFTVFKNDVDNPRSISDNYITSIMEDSNDDLWIGTRSGGINKYDIETGTFISYKYQIDNENSLSHNRVQSIVETADGNIWIGTLGGGLNKYNPKIGQFTKYTHDENDSLSISSDNINRIWMDRDGSSLWIGTVNGLNKFVLLTEKVIRYSNPNGSNYNDILSLWEDYDQRLWIGTNGEGLNVYDKQKETFRAFQNNPDDNSSLSNNQVIDLLEAEDGKIWVATDGGYLNLFDPINGTFDLHQVSFPRLKTLYNDNTGDLWVGSRGGVNNISPFHSMFTLYHSDNEGNLIAPNEDIHALCVDDNEFIWAGSSVDGLSKINRNTLELTNYKHSNRPQSLSDNKVRFLFIDSEKTMWIGTGNGLNRYNKNTDSFTNYLPNKNNPKSISSSRINYLYEDSKNNFWISTDKGLNKMNRKTGEFTVIKNIPTTANSLFSNNVSKFMEDDDGVYWIGFISNGMDKYDPKTQQFTHYQHIDGDKNSLSNNRVSQIYDDGNGHLWIATYGGGLDKFDKATGTFTNYNEKHGLANTSLYCVLADKTGNLWMSHNEGISMFDIKNDVFKNYFNGTEFNGRAYYQKENDEIFMGSIYAIVSFFPGNVIENKLIPPVHINEFKLFNKVVTPYDGQNILTEITEESDTIILQHNENFFSLGFVSLNFVNPENNQLKYKLENFDLEWNDAIEYHHASYTNVPPGNYTFKVMGSNNDLLWNEKGDSIFIMILPPWWDTVLFKTLAFVTTLALLVFMYKLRIRNIKKQKTDLEKLVSVRTKEVLASEAEIINQKESISQQNSDLLALNEEKNKLIQIVSHDLRSPLNQIQGLASIIKMINPDLNKETNDSINLINDLVDRQKNMISKVLDTNAIDTNSVNLQLSNVLVNELIVEVSSTLKVIAANKNIAIHLELFKKGLCIEVDRNYFIQVLENLLSNAIKFSPSDKLIIISTEQTNGKVVVSVKDQGPGISANEMQLLFEPYTKLSAKPTGNEDSSGLGLSIAKKYVENMNGKIWCESEEGKGANFMLSFDVKDC